MYTYEEVIEKIENTTRFGNYPGVQVMKDMLDKLSHPEANIPFIHVAGTNGKGSVCAFSSNLLEAAGLKVGRFTSPHLVYFEERISVNGEMISKDDVQRIGNMLLAQEYDLEPTYFDYCLAMALCYFKEKACDVMVVETGLGGSLDSTNAIGTPLVAVITKIGYDHTAILGDTLTQIASEKAGIIKEGCQVILERQEEEAYLVLKEASHNKYQMPDEELIHKIGSYKLRTLGKHQWENGATAVLAVDAFLKAFNMEALTEDKKQEVLENTHWMGRMDVLSQEPFFMVDGAHNGHGVHALTESLKALYPGEKFHFIMGVMADKDYEKMIEEILPLAIDFYTVTPESARALTGQKLCEAIASRRIPAKELHEITNVYELLYANKHSKERFVAFGSLYFIGELIGNL